MQVSIQRPELESRGMYTLVRLYADDVNVADPTVQPRAEFEEWLEPGDDEAAVQKRIQARIAVEVQAITAQDAAVAQLALAQQAAAPFLNRVINVDAQGNIVG